MQSGVTGIAARAEAMKADFEPKLPPLGNKRIRGGSDRTLIKAGNSAVTSSLKTERRQSEPAVSPGGSSAAFSHRALLSVEAADNRKPTGMTRARHWSTEVENSFRFQLAGFLDVHEYMQNYSCPEIWPENGFVKCLQAKKTGYFMYFRPHRECEDKHLNRVKIYSREG